LASKIRYYSDRLLDSRASNGMAPVLLRSFSADFLNQQTPVHRGVGHLWKGWCDTNGIRE
jgi:hypothetical protein